MDAFLHKHFVSSNSDNGQERMLFLVSRQFNQALTSYFFAC